MPRIDDPALGRRPAAWVGAGRLAPRFAWIWPGLLVVTVLSTIVWWRPLFAHQTMFHGDSIVFGLTLFDLGTRAVWHGASTVWANTIFGGHPLFAEGQGAFANPLSFAVNALVSPIAGPLYGMNLFHFLCMLLSGLGVLMLSRELGRTRLAGAFAALAVVFSPFWLEALDNPAISGALAWAPWTLWAFERWLDVPSRGSAVLLAVSAAAMLLAGYPQALHGTIIYMLVRGVVIAFYREERGEWLATWQTRVNTAMLALFLGGGLAAVQLLPQLELAGLSHRHGGTELAFQVPTKYTLRGLLYTARDIVNHSRSIPGVGSLLVCIPASMAIFLGRSSRISGHVIATLFLVLLGFGTASPAFRIIYDHHLIPGLHFFRVIVLYLAIGIVGIGVSAAAAIDGIAAPAVRIAFSRPALAWIAIGLTATWFWCFRVAGFADAPWIEFATVAGVAAGVAVAAALGRTELIPALFAALLATECGALRAQPFRFIDAAAVSEPGSSKAIKTLADWRDFKVIDVSLASVYAFQSSRAEGVVEKFHRMLTALSGSTPILWDLHGMDGALALPLTRLVEARPLLYDEIAGKTAAPPGSRLIDNLGIRFMSMDAPNGTPAFHLFWQQDGSTWLIENGAARPRFQAWDRADAVFVGSQEEAIARFRTLQEPTLIIESQTQAAAGRQDAIAAAETGAGTAMTVNVRRAEATIYDFGVDAQRPGWLFIADANYPGWRATLDGAPVQLYTAQVLGKAVAIPPGRHQLTVAFRSESVRAGAAISLVSVAAAIIVLIFGRRMPSLPKLWKGSQS